ncbi:MAG TPA: phosphoribosyltransferase family protein [Thermoanaerobaculia bacterium]
MPGDITSLVASEAGHFVLESGYHASMWLDLETLFLQPARIDPLAADLASRLSKHAPELVCGPLVEGAFVALLVARELCVPFAYTERTARRGDELYPFDYELPRVLRPHLGGKRVAVVNDVISAGSAVRGTAEAVEAAGGTLIAIGALFILGDWTRRFAGEKKIAVEALAETKFDLWKPENCPLCERAIPLQRRIQTT